MKNNSNISVTIGIPSYNEKKYIKKTIESALNQSYSNISIVVSDNNSNDGTVNFLKKNYKDRIVIYEHKKNIGMNENFKFLAEKANSKYFMWLGAHDYIHEKYVEEAINVHENHSICSLVYFQHQFVNNMYENIETIPLNSIVSTEKKRYKNAINLFQNLNYCTHIHGIWRLKDKNKIIPYFMNIVGPDHLILFIFSLIGEIKSIEKKYYFRLEKRNENYDQRFERYKKLNFKFDSSDPKYSMLENHFNYLLKNFYLYTFYKLFKSEKGRGKKYIKQKFKLIFNVF